MKVFLLAVMFLVQSPIVLAESTVKGYDIPISLNGYVGRAVFDGQPVGSELKNVVPGNYRVYVGDRGSFRFTLDQNGLVTIASTSAEVLADGRTISLNVVNVNLDFNGFEGKYRFGGQTFNASRASTIKMVDGMVETVDVGTGKPDSNVRLIVLANELICLEKGAVVAAQCSELTATFNTARFEFTPNGNFPYVVNGYMLQGKQTRHLVIGKNAEITVFDATQDKAFINFTVQNGVRAVLYTRKAQITVTPKY